MQQAAGTTEVTGLSNSRGALDKLEKKFTIIVHWRFIIAPEMQKQQNTCSEMRFLRFACRLNETHFFREINWKFAESLYNQCEKSFFIRQASSIYSAHHISSI
jgi:hypothetical protein